jgi:hypothetical protein
MRGEHPVSYTRRGYILRICVLAIGFGGTFALLPGAVAVGVWLVAVAVVSFVGGAALGPAGVVVSPIMGVAIAVRAELVSRHPIGTQAFVYDCVGLVIGVTVVALSGYMARTLVARRKRMRLSH